MSMISSSAVAVATAQRPRGDSSSASSLSSRVPLRNPTNTVKLEPLREGTPGSSRRKNVPLKEKVTTLQQELRQLRQERQVAEEALERLEARRVELARAYHQAEFPGDEDSTVEKKPAAPPRPIGGGTLNFLWHSNQSPNPVPRKKCFKVVRDYSNQLIQDTRQLFPGPEVPNSLETGSKKPSKAGDTSKAHPCWCGAYNPLFAHPNVDGSSGTVATQFSLAGSPSKRSFHSLFHQKARRTRMYFDYEGKSYLVDLQDPPDLFVTLP